MNILELGIFKPTKFKVVHCPKHLRVFRTWRIEIGDEAYFMPVGLEEIRYFDLNRSGWKQFEVLKAERIGNQVIIQTVKSENIVLEEVEE